MKCLSWKLATGAGCQGIMATRLLPFMTGSLRASPIHRNSMEGGCEIDAFEPWLAKDGSARRRRHSM